MKHFSLLIKLPVLLLIITLGATNVKGQTLLQVNKNFTGDSTNVNIGRFQVSSSNPAVPSPIDGILPPRVDTFPSTNPSARARGLLVYLQRNNTGTTNNTKGFYFWDGNNWVGLSTATAISALDATNDAWVNNPANTRVELGTTSTGAARAAGTQIIATDAGQIGVGTTTLAASSGIEVSDKQIRINNAEPGSGTLRVGAAFGTPGITAEGPQNLNLATGLDQVTNVPKTISLTTWNGSAYTEPMRVGVGTQAQTYMGSNFGIPSSLPTTTAQLNVQNRNTGGNILGLSDAGGDVKMLVQQNGNVGIGTTTPANTLHVFSNMNPLRLEGLQTNVATDNIMTVNASGVVTKTATAISTLDATNDAWVNNPTNNLVELGTTSTGAARAAGTQIIATDAGQIGVGTTSLAASSGIEVSDKQIRINNAEPGSGTLRVGAAFGTPGITAEGPQNLNLATGLDQVTNVPKTISLTTWNGSAYTEPMRVGVGTQAQTYMGSNFGIPSSLPTTTAQLNVQNRNTGGNILGLSDAGGDVKMLVQQNGNVGIGTTTPANTLHVFSNMNPLRLEGLQTNVATDNIMTVNASGVVTKTATAISTLDATNDAWVNNPTNNLVELGTTSTGAARAAGTQIIATDAGQIGVGTTSLAASSGIEVSDKQIRINNAEPGSGTLRVGAAFGTPGITVEGPHNLTLSAGEDFVTNIPKSVSFVSWTGNAYTEPMRVGVGTQAQTYMGSNFGIPSSLPTTTAQLNVQNTNTGGNILGLSDAGGNVKMLVAQNGNVGIGTTTPTSKLAIVGLPIFADNTAAASLSVGDFYRTATGTVMVKY